MRSMPNKSKYTDFNSPGSIARLAAVIAILNLAAYLMGCWWLVESRDTYQARARIESQNISRVLAQSIAYAFDKVELVLTDAQHEIARRTVEGTLDNARMAPFLSAWQMRVPELESLRATDAEGTLIYGHGMPTDPPTSVSDDSHFDYLRDNPGAGTGIAKPKFCRLNQAWVIKISRRYNRADGSFGGVINGAIRLENLLALVPELNVGPNGFIALRDSDLGIVFRLPQPGIGRDIGQRRVPREYLERIQAQEKSGTFIAVSPNDGYERMVAFHKVGKWDMHLSVGLASEHYLSQWRRELRFVAAGETVFTLLSVLLAVMLYRHGRERSLHVARLQEQQALFRSLAEISSDWFWEQDADYRFTHLSRELSYRTELDFGSIVGKTRWQIAVEPGEEEWERHRAILDAHQPFQDFEYSFIDANGRKRTLSTNGSPVFDSEGQFIGYRGTSKDITERHEYEQRIQSMAQFDSLTGLPNRTVFYDRLNQAIGLARRKQHPFALLYLDLDKFKPVNDIYGHGTGDRLLKAMAQRLEYILRESDTLARLGGDEFALIMPQISSTDDPVTVAEKVIGVISDPFRVEGVDADLVIGVSIGIAVFPNDAESPDDLVKAADKAMYCAKAEGNACRFYIDCADARAMSGAGSAGAESGVGGQVSGPASAS